MDTDGIKALVRAVDQSQPRGKTFHVGYEVTRTCTDFYYDHANEMIQYLQNYRDKAKVSPSADDTPASLDQIEGFIASFKRELKAAREAHAQIEYSLSDQGFYMKQEMTWPNPRPGGIAHVGPMISVSDGKIMGTFFNDNQATIQPATERPQQAFDDWSRVAYNLNGKSIADHVVTMPSLTAALDGPDLKISGWVAREEKEGTEMELRIDRQTLRPRQITEINYDLKGAIYNKLVKRWDYQDFSGVVMPKTVVDETYLTGLDGQTRLSEVQTLTINSFSPIPVNAKESLAALLKTNRSIFDEITGSHYLSGNPEATLDRLSK